MFLFCKKKKELSSNCEKNRSFCSMCEFLASRNHQNLGFRFPVLCGF